MKLNFKSSKVNNSIEKNLWNKQIAMDAIVQDN